MLCNAERQYISQVILWDDFMPLKTFVIPGWNSLSTALQIVDLLAENVSAPSASLVVLLTILRTIHQAVVTQVAPALKI